MGAVAAACAVTEGLSKIVILPASQRPHVRAITHDSYHVGRGNARLMSQGDGRAQPLTRFAEGSRGLFPLLPFFGIKNRFFPQQERNGFCLVQLISCEQVIFL